ncbi:TetR/AcrR family transcriptional regulator [Clostridium sporogenes]|uniref:TetR/AcrR family transcriptional regulator n=1 Tax=Clostridium sporogenes TaxID=1509 RepID=UPI0013D7F91F|nr:TetR/AcrR family transcriptional regulator [Clostridium sporogenes]EJE7235624.1 TetR/AcrR family transcriptional regulator [Clostridium botulinum]NFE82049.1 TetR/AcrR family transcriptional regulator [Clostridium sporogenes]NFG70285.1 TetR/AcrR family transcriptional regulator [Clostridium sporogenes]HDK7167510.1 TetR/AcrR family transcriptional regulator [Clostridium botulinum]
MKQKILDITSKNIELYGLKKFTMDDISYDLKISKKTIYKYFKSKNDLISQYFNEIIDSDKKSTLELLEKKMPLDEKLYNIIYSYHKYKLPVRILDEAYKFYPEEFKKIQEFKNFKIDLVKKILKEGKNQGVIEENININIVSLILEKVSDTFLDYKFLTNNNITMKQAMVDLMNILLNGILNEKYNG